MGAQLPLPTPWRLLLTAIYLLVYPVLVLALGGDLRWIEGWLFAGWFVGTSFLIVVYLYRKDPALLAERYRRPDQDTQRWDRVFVYGISVVFLVWLAVMPLDAVRFHWTPAWPILLEVVGGLLLIASTGLLFRAFADNTFLSPLVRIQEERQHQVVSSGVYSFVRHPMYLGAVGMAIGAPLLLGSAVGVGLGIVLVGLIVARIRGEERLLVDRLRGYADYRQQVRYRLIPHVW